MNINLSQHAPRKVEGTTIIQMVSILTRMIKIILEDITEIYPKSDVIHVTRKETFLESVLETKVALTRKRETKEDIILTLQRMVNLLGRESNKKVNILQVMKSMF